MLVSCHRTDGIGLSAPQVGVNVQLMVFNAAGVKGEGEEIVLVNPVVYKFSKRLLVDEEGCLSFPEIYANVLVRIISKPIPVWLFAIRRLHLSCFKVTMVFHLSCAVADIS